MSRWWASSPPHLASVPLLRGRLHQAGFLAAVAAGAVLVTNAGGGAPRATAWVYALSACLMFATSAVYHRRAWTPAARALMRRVDHGMVLVLVAGSATPLTVLVGPDHRWVVLVALWTATAAAAAVQLLWRGCPRWVVHPLAVLVGLGCLLPVPALVRAGESATLVLLGSGVVVYLVGMVVLVRKGPDPKPALFGYHELFHALTLVAGTLVFLVNFRVTST